MVGVDVAPVRIQLPRNTHFIQQDVLAWDAAFIEAVGTGFDIVLSDMAPSTTGNKFVDAQRSLELSKAALAISMRVLKTGGAFICKVFQGEDFKSYSNAIKGDFKRVAHMRPKSTRKASKEIYIVALGKKDTTA